MDDQNLTINKHEPMSRQYQKVYEHYKRLLGDQIAVLMACGDFYEIYWLENEHGKATNNGDKISELLNIHIKHRKNGPLSDTNPWSAGFPKHNISKWRNILTSHDYSIIVCDEVPSTDSPKQRYVSNIWTPGLSPMKTYEANNVVCLFIEHQNPSSKLIRFDKLELIIGAAAIDVTTNESIVFEVSSTYTSILNGDSNAIEEIYRFLHSNRCRELSIHLTGFIIENADDKKRLIKYFRDVLHLDDYYVHDITINSVPQDYSDIRTMNRILQKGFTEEITGVGVGPLEYMNLTYNLNAATAYILLLEYIRIRNSKLTFSLTKIKNWRFDQRLILTHNAQQQLNLISYKNSRDKSLFDVIDFTTTAMGKRFLEMILLHPYADITTINQRYDEVEAIFVGMPESGKDLSVELKGIVDLPRFHRKIDMRMLSPKSLERLILSYEAVIRLIAKVRKIKVESLQIPEDVETKFVEFSQMLKSTFNMQILSQCKSYKSVNLNVFQPGVSEDIDELSLRAANIDDYVQKIARDLAIILDPNVSEDKIAKFIKVENPAKGGRYFKVSHQVKGALIVYQQLIASGIEKIPKYASIEDVYRVHRNSVNEVSFREWGEKILSKSNKLPEPPIGFLSKHEIDIINACEFSSQKSTTKIHCGLVQHAENSSASVINEFCNLMTTVYCEYLYTLYVMNSKVLENVEKWVAAVDVAKSNATAAFQNRYVRPIVVKSDKSSFIRAKKVRHPIVEVVQDDISFVPNDIVLGFSGLDDFQSSFPPKPENEESKELENSGSTEDQHFPKLAEGADFSKLDEEKGSAKTTSDQTKTLGCGGASRHSLGMFLFGHNNGGKSIYLKMTGLSIVMAQAGMFVPAEEFTFASFNNIITRLSGNDDMYRRQGSFAVEMSELRTVINQSGPFTLALGDEICHGTEQKSALAIVGASVVKLCERKANFIFSTHLRLIPELDEIHTLTENGQLRYCHFTTILNKLTDEVIFEYKLHEGLGESLYGIEIAEMMGLGADVCSLAYKLRHVIENPETHDIPLTGDRKSRYNSKLRMGICEIEGCGKPAVDTHHIREQSEADENGYIDHFHKNMLFNVVGLCKEHHLEQSFGKVKILGKMMTSKGVKIILGEN